MAWESSIVDSEQKIDSEQMIYAFDCVYHLIVSTI